MASKTLNLHVKQLLKDFDARVTINIDIKIVLLSVSLKETTFYNTVRDYMLTSISFEGKNSKKIYKNLNYITKKTRFLLPILKR